MENVFVSDHPLIQHKITMLRDKNTGTAEFRAIASEIAMLLGYEALKDLETEDVEVETPLEKTMSPVIVGKNQVVVPILRAGLGMTDGVLKLLPTAKVGHVGMMRDEETHVAHTYYCKFPDQLDERIIIVTDPMLATGGSASDAIDLIKKNGGKYIKFMCIVATMTGIEKLHTAHPDVPIYVGHVDRELNENAYILPGLGDAGDRIFGTKGI